MLGLEDEIQLELWGNLLIIWVLFDFWLVSSFLFYGLSLALGSFELKLSCL
jgi:hypothetical protein